MKTYAKSYTEEEEKEGNRSELLKEYHKVPQPYQILK